MTTPSPDDVAARVRATGLLPRGEAVLVLLSGGRDSVCLVDVAVRLAGREAVRVLHVDHGLRADAGEDEALCRELCARLGVPLHVARPRRPARGAGNLQAWARARRHEEAARLAGEGGRVAAGHTATDQVETVLYRLAASPGRRALLGMRAAEALPLPAGGPPPPGALPSAAPPPGAPPLLVRPLLGVTREETAAYCAARGLAWREDPSNASPAYARNRVRHALLPALRALHPAAEANVLVTLERLRDEAVVLDAAVDHALAQAGEPPAVDALAVLGPALGRLALQRLADRATPGGRAPAVGHRAEEVLALARDHGALDLGGGLRAVVAQGRLRVLNGPADDPAPLPPPAWLDVPGRARWGLGELRAERGGARCAVADGTLDLAALAPPLEVRAWRAGDRMRPLGLNGTKRLQDLFVDRGVPRAERRALPVVLSGGEPAWIPGVATGERFRVRAGTLERVRLSWRPHG